MATLPAYLSPGVQVQQPPHLEGDASLATEILPGPPSLVAVQQSTFKRDPRKPSVALSYLPTSDPGSTYSGLMHGSLVGQEPDGPRSKRSRLDKSSNTGRAQRASARNQTGVTTIAETLYHDDNAPPLTVFPDSDPYTMVLDDEIAMSRSTSSHNLPDDSMQNGSTRNKRKDKGKGREVEVAVVRVKEEPKLVSLQTPEPLTTLSNDDHCSSCRSSGALVYCDGCPRAFHFWCLDPPIESVDEGDTRWFCPSCTTRKHPPRKPHPSLLSPLIHQVETSIPCEFQLPEDIRTYFKDVATGPKGTYLDSSEIKQPRLNRHGQLEDRDAHRLKDRNGLPILCFQCGTSALPAGVSASLTPSKLTRGSSSAASTPEIWRSIISCDYCGLHWHLDCLDPPLSGMPSFSKKWMCPNHAERVLPLKRRVPRQNAPPIEISKARQYNNGNIEVIQPEATQLNHKTPKVAVDEVLINGRRYRVPERVIVLDFWNKVNKDHNKEPIESEPRSELSSPLTSLSSLEDLEGHHATEFDTKNRETDELQLALMLCSLQSSKTSSLPMAFVPPRSTKFKQAAVQTESESNLPSKSSFRQKEHRSFVISAATKKSLPAKVQGTNGSTHSKMQATTVGDRAPRVEARVAKRKSTQHRPSESTRELRSRSKNSESLGASLSSSRAEESSLDSILTDLSASAPPRPISPTLRKPRVVTSRVKLEETDNAFNFHAGSRTDSRKHPEASTSKATPKRPRAARPQVPKDADEYQKPEAMKRGRKRKEREEEGTEVVTASAILKGTSEQGRIEKATKKKPEDETITNNTTRTPARHRNTLPTSTVGSASQLPTTPSTPSLKIRLPRLSNVHVNASPGYVDPSTQL